MENNSDAATEIMMSVLKLEQLAQLAICIVALYHQPVHMAWWLWPLLFLLPDISTVGYLINTRVGAACYNIAHHKAVAGLFICIGFFFHLPVWFLIGFVFYGHSSFDRALGYGLKYADSFQHTHLGFIGKKKDVEVIR
jgi:hypothetical protein